MAKSIELDRNKSFEIDRKLSKKIDRYIKLTSEIKKFKITKETFHLINQQNYILNATDKKSSFRRHLSGAYHKILIHFTRKSNYVPNKYYRNLWIGLGFTIFGLAIGILLLIFTDDLTYLLFTIPIGIALGYFIGVSLDSKAKEDGRVIMIN